MVKLGKIDSVGRLKDIPLSDTSQLTAPDEETRAAAGVLETLQKQQPGTSHHRGLNQLTPPGEAEFFKGGGW